MLQCLCGRSLSSSSSLSDVLSMVLYRRRRLETNVKIRLKTRSRRLKSKPWEHQRTPDSREYKLTGAHQTPPYLHWNQAPPKGQQVPEQDIPCKFSNSTGTQPWASIYRLPKLILILQLCKFQQHYYTETFNFQLNFFIRHVSVDLAKQNGVKLEEIKIEITSLPQTHP